MLAPFCTYKNIPCLQHPDYERVLSNFLLTEQFTDIIEIGTAKGGLTLFVKDTLPQARVVTYDIVKTPYYDQLVEAGIEVNIQNVFSSNYEKLIDVDLINHIILDSRKLLIMVDGGNKIGEFSCIAKYLKFGQYMMTHDYIKNQEIFLRDFQNKIWDWIEVTEKDIMPSCLQNNLIAVKARELNSIVWQCVKKL